MDEGRNIIFDMCYTRANHENKPSNIALTKLDSSLCRIYEKVHIVHWMLCCKYKVV